MHADLDGATLLDPDEVEGLKFNHIKTRGELDELEQANIQQGLLWLGARKRKVDVLTDTFIRELHFRLFGDVWTWAGKFRQTEKNIGIDPAQIPMQLRLLLDDARYWVQANSYSPLEAAIRFHHRLVLIHPFPNGNGRHARIATDIFLAEYFDHPLIAWADGFDLQADSKRRGAYIQSLRAADKGDLSPLLEFAGIQPSSVPTSE